jgi:putative membrane protein
MNQQSAVSPDPRASKAEDRNLLAMFRTQLALDRTTLAWIRTTLTMGTFGFGLVGFFRSLRQSNPNAQTIQLHEGAIFFGKALIVLGIVATIVAGLSHLFTLRRLREGNLPALSLWPLSVTVAMLLAIAGIAGLWLLFVQ